ncbi:MAG: ATP cone domain-containing protein [Candidatus Bathyarchaeota archaeon]|nr:ATP cone domain-containing protein [Candidatus Bathyarchaeota archaeon]
MAVSVTKANGTKQPYDPEKIIQTCLRLGASHKEALQIEQKIARKLYDGISTQKILQLIFTLMRKSKPAVRHLFDLRRGISLMASKPEFEVYVRTILAQSGFAVQPNTVLRGLCGEHEVDAIAQKDGVTYLVEVKHHVNYHALTGLDESRIARAIIEDVTEGYQNGTSTLKVDRAMIVTNTRFSDHALAYGSCRGILQIGWASPEGFSLKETINKYKLYPLSCLRGVKVETRLRLVEAGIVLIKQLLQQDAHYLERKLGLPYKEVAALLEKAAHTTETLW